ncbi:MAG: TetR/AcrR family transcriptional regulator [Bacteroidota bacterium]
MHKYIERNNMNEEFENIISRVTELYYQYGIKSVTMDDVARELGMSKKTLYKYISNKDELVEYCINSLVQKRNCAFKRIEEENVNAIEELFLVNEHVIKMLKNYNPSTEYDLKKYYPHLYEKLRKYRRENMYEAVKNNIIKGKQEGLYRKNLNEDIISRVHVSRIENSYANEMFGIDELTSWKFVREMFTYHLHGIANEAGIKIFYEKLKDFEKKLNT